MSDDEYNEAKKLIAELGSIRKAAKAKGKPYATFRRQYLKREQPQAAPQAEQSEPQPEPEPIVHPNLAAIDWSEIHRRQREAERPKFND